MTITCKFFAILRDRAHTSEVALQLPDESTVSDATVAIGKQFPHLQALLSRTAFAVNQQYVPRDTKLKDGDELALIPPVSGGSA